MAQVLERPPGAQLVLELTDTERQTLERCEAVIEAGRQTFIEVGDALLTIRDNKLYREKHKTFEGYCGDRWQIGRATAYRMMEAADVVINLKEAGVEQLPANQAQATALAELPADKQPEAWQKAVESAPEGKPTAADVKAAVQEIAPKPEPEPVAVVDRRSAPPEEVAAIAQPESAPATTPRAPEVQTPAQAPTPPPAAKPAAEAKPAAAPPAESKPSPMVHALLPEDEYEWVCGQGWTLGLAIAKLREFTDNPPASPCAIPESLWRRFEEICALTEGCTGVINLLEGRADAMEKFHGITREEKAA